MTLLANFCVLSNAKLSKSTINKPLSLQHVDIPPPFLFFLAHTLANGRDNSFKEQHNLSLPKLCYVSLTELAV